MSGEENSPESMSPDITATAPAGERSMAQCNMAALISSCPFPRANIALHSNSTGGGYACIASMASHDGQVLCVAPNARGLLYTASQGRNVRVWSRPQLEEYGGFGCGIGGVSALLAVSRGEDCQLVFSAHADRRIRVWRRSRPDGALHRRLATLPTLKDRLRNFTKAVPLLHADAITCLAYCKADGLLYSSSVDKTVKVWRASDFRCVETIGAHDQAVNAVAVGSADGLLFTASDDGTVKVWRRAVVRRDATLHVRAASLEVQYSAVKALAIGPGGWIVYGGSSDGNINYWCKNQAFGHMHHAGILRGHRNAVLCLATVENLVVSGSADRTIRVWKRDSVGMIHGCLTVLEGHRGPVKSVAASVEDDECLVYSGGLDGSVKVWWTCS